MLVFSEAKIVVRKGRVTRVEGKWTPYDYQIRQWIPRLGLRRATISYRSGRIHFNGVDADDQQRLRNFLFNECRI